MNWNKIFAQEVGNKDENVEPCESWKKSFLLKSSVGNYPFETSLCGKASESDKKNAYLMKRKADPEQCFIMTPPCVHRGGCPYSDTSCKLYDFLCQTDERFFRTDLLERYTAYDKWWKTTEDK